MYYYCSIFLNHNAGCIYVHEHQTEHDTNYYIAITIVIIIILIIIAAISFIMYLEKDLFSMNNILHVNYYLLYYQLKYP